MGGSSLARIIAQRVERYGERTALRYRTGDAWREMSWRELGENVRAAASALVALGLAPRATAAIFSSNRVEWIIADLAIASAGCVSVPIYPTNTAAQAGYILADSGARLVFAGGLEQYEKARTAAPDAQVIVFDSAVPLGTDPVAMCFEDFLALGREAARWDEVAARTAAIGADDLLTLIYTSGTTGEPKGVMLTNGNLEACFRVHDQRLAVSEDDSSLCFLPLSHVFERAWSSYTLYRGIVNTILDDATKVVEAMQQVRPTAMCAVPRFYEKVYATVLSRVQAAPALRRRLFHWAIGVGGALGRYRKDALPAPLGLRLRHAIADALVLAKLRAVVGGRVRFLPCAGAPLSQEIEEFFWAAGIPVKYGYGLTETTATVSCHEDVRFRFGSVGRPMPELEVRIGEGDEIQVKGPTVMKGYYNKPEATREAFVDGWFRTGDAGRIDEAGFLYVTERIKDLMKTSGGKYIAPQAIESRLGSDPFVEQVAVIGDQRRFVSALVVPSFAILEPWARERSLAFASREELVALPMVRELYAARIDALNHDLARYEQIKAFTLLSREFTVEGGEITPTLKVKRRRVAELYRDAIESMYSD